MPAALQEPLLRVSEDAERIKRVIAVSARWLSLHDAKRTTALAIERLPGATPFVRSIVVTYGGEVELVGPSEDRPLTTDPGWLQIALRNLVDNALAHGKPPVRVVMHWQRRKLAVDVIDAGDTRHVSVDDLAREFRKGPTSSGLGLGLAIVSRIATALGGVLEHHADPTTFRLVVADLEGRT
jgi:signal transduction histidine kinase